MKLSGWGRFPAADVASEQPPDLAAFRAALQRGAPCIARGAGCSYGDSALSARVLRTRRLNYLHEFDSHSGVLTCGAGVTLAEIIRVFLPRGWFLPVSPGTKFVTVGGAVASDVHGKNHHLEGTFSQHVLRIELLLGSGESIHCSRTEHPELFLATCGGMGLTGVIVTITLHLRRVRSSRIVETTLRATDVQHAVELFEAHQSSTYSVAWIDCLASGRRLGRSLLMLGEHAEDGDLSLPAERALPVPIDMPTVILNRYSIGLFNALYFHRVGARARTRTVPYEPYFYPLDKLRDWNRLYGRRGFLQYQFVLPPQAGLRGLRAILQRIVASGRGSFLAVLKAFGPANESPLSFPQSGFTLALDFKNEPEVFPLLDTLDGLVLDYGGRIYLTKDARMSADTFRRGYPRWQDFEAVRARYGAIGHFASLQSRRLGLQ